MCRQAEGPPTNPVGMGLPDICLCGLPGLAAFWRCSGGSDETRTMESILSKLKPEAAYFAPLEGKRGGMIFFDLADPSHH
jgi:hypothetical protein